MLDVLASWTGPSAFAGVIASVWWIARLDARVLYHETALEEHAALVKEMNRVATSALQRLSRIEGRIIGLQNGQGGLNGHKK